MVTVALVSGRRHVFVRADVTVSAHWLVIDHGIWGERDRFPLSQVEHYSERPGRAVKGRTA